MGAAKVALAQKLAQLARPVYCCVMGGVAITVLVRILFHSHSQADSGLVTLSFFQASLDTEAHTITNMDGQVHED